MHDGASPGQRWPRRCASVRTPGVDGLVLTCTSPWFGYLCAAPVRTDGP